MPLVVGLGKCCELALDAMDEESAESARLRDSLWTQLNGRIDGLVLNGHPELRLAGNLNISVPGVDGEALMTGLTRIAVSSGSACTSADPEPSHVLQAMGVRDDLRRASLRFGIGRFNTQAHVDDAAVEVAEVVQRLRGLRIS